MPVAIGARFAALSPIRLGARIGVGFTPEAYVRAANGIAQGFGAYDDSTAELIERATSNALYVSAQLLYRFGERSGFEVAAGYSLLSGQGQATNRLLLEAATGRSFPGLPGNSNAELRSTVHNFAVDVGYRFAIRERWQVAASIGLVKPIASSSSVDFARLNGPGEDAVSESIDEYLDETYKKYVYIPTVSVHAGYSF